MPDVIHLVIQGGIRVNLKLLGPANQIGVFVW